MTEEEKWFAIAWKANEVRKYAERSENWVASACIPRDPEAHRFMAGRMLVQYTVFDLKENGKSQLLLLGIPVEWVADSETILSSFRMLFRFTSPRPWEIDTSVFADGSITLMHRGDWDGH